MKTAFAKQIIAPNHDALLAASEVLTRGGLVAVPTETVYGLAADATNGEAVARIFAAKGRPQFNPLICHVCSLEMAQDFARFDNTSLALASAFWPGPLTLVLPLKEGAKIHPLVTAGMDSIAVRFPRGIAAELIAKFGQPLAAPSANASGKISPTTALAVRDSLDHKVDLIIDDGPCTVGLESTIVKVAGGALTVLRPGTVTSAEIKKASQMNLLVADADSAIQAPGMLASHYAPDALLRLNAKVMNQNEALLAFGPNRVDGADSAVETKNLSASGDLIEAAANLFSMMASLDKSGAKCIAAEPIPNEGIGVAINDRLMRAAAPRG